MRNPEQLRYQQPGEWGRLLGLDRCCAPDTLRRKLAQLCDQPVAVQAWADQLARHWLADEQDALAALFVDGHVKVYTGQARLPKHFVSRQRLQLPADTGFWIHKPGGKPLLCLRQQVDPGMVEVLREQLLPELQQLGLLPPPAAADQRQPSIVTTHPTLPAAEVAGLLRSRWSQENNFKWLCQEFGLDSLPQHATEAVEPATVIANPAMRLIDKALKSDKARAGRQQAHWRGRPAQAKRREIKAAIDAVETQIAGLQRARKSTDSHILAGELPHEIRPAALPMAFV